MARATIDFGIDLGTTNSVIAVLNGATPEVFENEAGQKCTPSAVWIDRKGAMHVGQLAKERREMDPENAYSEFKLKMGYPDEYLFTASQRSMTPQDLSAEVLKSLCYDVQRRSGEQVLASVVTIPAAFEDPQMKATRQSAAMAGLQDAPLLIEPIAAAQAYGFEGDNDRTFWLVFDFGGGTFDAALINVRDGAIHVANHAGDNHLGGKLLDWAIVDKILVPALTKEYRLTDFNRSNTKYMGAFARLKLAAEKAKIHCSSAPHSLILIDPLCQDDRNESVVLEYELTAQEVADLITPLVERAVNKSKQVLEEARLGSDDIEKILLVGGPTMTPILREIVSERMNIPLEYSIDPLTVVARGAAIFARSKMLNVELPPPAPDTYQIKLDYKPVDADPEPLIGGQVLVPRGVSPTGITIEFVEQRSQWRSGQIPVSDKGRFQAVLKAEEGQDNQYVIELRLGSQALSTTPDKFSILVKQVGVSKQTHSLGVGLADDEMCVLLSKDTELGSSRTNTNLHTSHELLRGHMGDVLNIPVYSGENVKRASRNHLVGILDISAEKVSMDVPEGSAIHITMSTDDQANTEVTAYLPLLDQYFEAKFESQMPADDVAVLAADFDTEKTRLSKLQTDVNSSPEPRAQEVLKRIEQEHMIEEIETALRAAQGGGEPDALNRGRNRLLDLQIALDQGEAAIAWPKLVNESKEALEWARGVINDLGDNDERPRLTLKALETEIDEAIANRDMDALESRIRATWGLGHNTLQNYIEYWEAMFANLKTQKAFMTDPGAAQALISRGETAIANKNKTELEEVVWSLRSLQVMDEGTNYIKSDIR